MITRDYILRQIRQLVQALSLVLFHRREREFDLAQTVLENTLVDALGLPLDRLLALDREALLALCSRDGALHGELAVAIADLLRQHESAEADERARWLYRAALEVGAAVPMDVEEFLGSD